MKWGVSQIGHSVDFGHDSFSTPEIRRNKRRPENQFTQSQFPGKFLYESMVLSICYIYYLFLLGIR